MALLPFCAKAEWVPNRVLVKFKDSDALSSFSQTARFGASPELGLSSIVRSLKHNTAVVRFATGLDAREAAAALRSDPNVAWAQPDYVMNILPFVDQNDTESSDPFSAGLRIFAAIPDPATVVAPALPSPAQADPRIGEAWGLDRIHAQQAWAMQGGSKSILVADIDTGIDYRHEDLVNNLWDGIGYDFVNNDNLPFDDQSHGTHTAGTIGATGGNGKGISGVSPKVSIMALKFITAEGGGTTSDAVRAIDYAISKGVRIMSNSWGGRAEPGDDNQALVDAVARADAAGILFVAAAGNDGTDNDADPVYPAAIDLPHVLTVASTSPRDSISFFSNYGRNSVDVGAPGGGILSTVPNNGYTTFNGTSMACPHVAGLAALILAEKPELTALQVKQIIMETVDVLPGLQGKTVTGGRVNARAALERARNFGI